MNKILSSILLILSSPFILVLIFIGAFIYGNPFFQQTRIGKEFREFSIVKFRSIPIGADQPDAWGRFIRKYSLDELLQLINIVKGEMNFIGPRPLLPEYNALYSDHHRRRSKVKPGLSGWAQVKGRNNLTWTEQFDLDVWYVENQSFALDCKIIGLTLLKLIIPAKGETQLREKYNGRN